MQTPKIIFLDIDGPMIPYRAMFLPGQKSVMTVFDPVAVSLLNHLCSEHGWKIVLHTSWVRIIGGQNTYDHCVSQGIRSEHFHEDAWTDEHENWRYTRVAKWLKAHPDIKHYVMLDDDPYHPDIKGTVDQHPVNMADHLILVDYYAGFMFSTYNEVKARDPDVKNIEPYSWYN